MSACGHKAHSAPLLQLQQFHDFFISSPELRSSFLLQVGLKFAAPGSSWARPTWSQSRRVSAAVCLFHCNTEWLHRPASSTHTTHNKRHLTTAAPAAEPGWAEPGQARTCWAVQVLPAIGAAALGRVRRFFSRRVYVPQATKGRIFLLLCKSVL